MLNCCNGRKGARGVEVAERWVSGSGLEKKSVLLHTGKATAAMLQITR